MPTGGQTCTDITDIEYRGDNQLSYNRFAIFPRFNFNCNGRITNIRATVDDVNIRLGFLTIQVWRPSSPGSMKYNKINGARLQSYDQVTSVRGRQEANISLYGENRIEFQSGDVIGYYHPPNSRYQVKDIQTRGYVMYRFDGSPPPTSVNLNEADAMLDNRQPLIQFTFGK